MNAVDGEEAKAGKRAGNLWECVKDIFLKQLPTPKKSNYLSAYDRRSREAWNLMLLPLKFGSAKPSHTRWTTGKKGDAVPGSRVSADRQQSCERVVRLLAIGRKNWISIMSEDGGKRMAILYSIISTCKLNNIDPKEYLADVWCALWSRPMEIERADLTPVEWLEAKNGGNCWSRRRSTPYER